MYLAQKRPQLLKIYLQGSTLQSEKGEHQAIINAFYDYRKTVSFHRFREIRKLQTMVTEIGFTGENISRKSNQTLSRL